MSHRDQPPGLQKPVPSVDVLVRTFNSARTLRDCLQSIRLRIPVHRLIVVDRNSTDATGSIVRQFGGEIHFEESGLGYATTRAIMLAETSEVLFVDSDVTITRADFFPTALRMLDQPRVGAVVGGAVGHPFLYGLPLGLTLFRRAWVAQVEIPPEIQGTETYFIRRALARQRLGVAYVPDAMTHASPYRGRSWPEFQGANTRLSSGWSVRELVFSLAVILLIHLNSRKARNFAYTPIFYLKFLRGFLRPDRWSKQDRRDPALR